MSDNPLVLALRFLLELGALAALAVWGWTQHDGLLRWAWTLGLPLAAATAWGVFRSPVDPQDPIVAVPGLVRLLVELAVFGGGAAALYASGRPMVAAVFAALVLLHYALSWDRVADLLRI